MPTPLHGKTSVVTKKVSYTTQFGYLAVWEASEVFASIGHWDTYGLSCIKEGIIWISCHKWYMEKTKFILVSFAEILDS